MHIVLLISYGCFYLITSKNQSYECHVIKGEEIFPATWGQKYQRL